MLSAPACSKADAAGVTRVSWGSPELPLWSSFTPQDPAPSHIGGSRSLSGAIRLKTSITIVVEILRCVHCVSSICSTESGFKPAKHPWGNCFRAQTRTHFLVLSARKHVAAFLRQPRPHTTAARGWGRSWCPFGEAAGAGCVLCPGSLQPPIPSAGAQQRGSIWKIEPSDAPAAASPAKGLVAGRAALVIGRLPSHPSEQGVGVVGAAGRKAQGAAFFQRCPDKSSFSAVSPSALNSRGEELAGGSHGTAPCPYFGTCPLPSPPWAFSSLIQQNAAALQEKLVI
ncbi:uncharacterized protein LOC141931219 [Strix aluco]|uniref:uncharacterized protein LOC141931219 n=1 Tax=Strix aluco TaxID=111821 RepID=UPI003DA21326